MLIRFLTGVVLGIFTACGAQVDDGGTSGSLNVGGSVSSAGGNTSVSTGVTVGGSVALSTGGSTAIDMNTYCGGVFANTNACHWEQFVNVSSCDIPLQRSPMDISEVQVAADCNLVPPANSDAGRPDGFYIDYNQSPVHLELAGTYCTRVSTNEIHNVVMVEGCVMVP